MTFHVNFEINWFSQISFQTRSGFWQCKDLYILVRQKMQRVIRKCHKQNCNSVINQIFPGRKGGKVIMVTYFAYCVANRQWKIRKNILNFQTLKYAIEEASFKILLSYLLWSPLLNIKITDASNIRWMALVHLNRFPYLKYNRIGNWEQLK